MMRLVLLLALVGALVCCPVSAAESMGIDEPQGAAALFLKYNYAETKDLAKAFLTLASAILAFSVTFAEKVVDLQNSQPAPRILIMGS